VLFLFRLAMWQPYVFYVSLSDALWWASSIFKSHWYLLVGFRIEFDFILLCQMCFNAFDKNADLNVMDHPILNFIYYLVRFFLCFSIVVHLLPTLCAVLFYGSIGDPFRASWEIGCRFTETTTLNTISPLVTNWDVTGLKGCLFLTVSSYCAILIIIYLGRVGNSTLDEIQPKNEFISGRCPSS
jgi:hypothetical protein